MSPLLQKFFFSLLTIFLAGFMIFVFVEAGERDFARVWPSILGHIILYVSVTGIMHTLFFKLNAKRVVIYLIPTLIAITLITQHWSAIAALAVCGSTIWICESLAKKG